MLNLVLFQGLYYIWLRIFIKVCHPAKQLEYYFFVALKNEGCFTSCRCFLKMTEMGVSSEFEHALQTIASHSL